jgi:hypothetical protein
VDVGEFDVNSLLDLAAQMTHVRPVGMLGAPAFRSRVLEMDYPAMRVRLHAAGVGMTAEN